MIDIKELRIGNHVLCNGQRVEIDSIGGGDQVGLLTNSLDDWFETDVARLEPIPITEELLKELGFEKFRNKYIIHPDRNGTPLVSISDGGCYGWHVERGGASMFVKYLHELETFVFLTTKKELI